MIEQVYIGIKELLLAVPGIVHVAWYNRQYEDSEEKQPYDRPAAFIEFLPVDPDSIGHKVQKGEVTIRVHLVTEDYYDTPRSDNEQEEDEALAHLRLAQEVYKALHGKNKKVAQAVTPPLVGGASGEVQIFNSLKRTKIIPDHEHDNLIVTKQEFTTLAHDYAAVKPTTKANQPDLKLC